MRERERERERDGGRRRRRPREKSSLQRKTKMQPSQQGMQNFFIHTSP